MVLNQFSIITGFKRDNERIKYMRDFHDPCMLLIETHNYSIKDMEFSII